MHIHSYEESDSILPSVLSRWNNRLRSLEMGMLGRGCLGSQKALESMSYKEQLETSLVAQWLRFCAGGMGSIPGQQTKIPHTLWCSQKKKKKPVKEAKCV